MPAPCSWLARVPEIIDAVEQCPHSTFDRRWIEQLFDLRRTAAAALTLQIPGAFRAGKTWMVHRRELLLWLYGVRESGCWAPSAAARQRVAQVVEEGRATVRQRQPIVTVPTRTLSAGLDDLPAGVELQPTRLAIDFNGFEDLFGKLFTLAQVIANDDLRVRAYLDSEAQTRSANG